MKQVRLLRETLLAANTKQLSLENSLTVFAEDEDDYDSAIFYKNIKPLALQANDLIDKIDCMSFVLVCYNWNESAFASPVIGFVVLHTVNEEGA